MRKCGCPDTISFICLSLDNAQAVINKPVEQYIEHNSNTSMKLSLPKTFPSDVLRGLDSSFFDSMLLTEVDNVFSGSESEDDLPNQSVIEEEKQDIEELRTIEPIEIKNKTVEFNSDEESKAKATKEDKNAMSSGNWISDSISEFLFEKVIKGVKEFIKSRQEKISTFFGDNLGLGILGQLIPAYCLEVLDFAKKNPSKIGAGVGTAIVLIQLPKLYKHAYKFYKHDSKELSSLQTVFPVEGIIGIVGNNAVMAIIAALGLRNLWKHAIKEEAKNDEKDSDDFFSLLTGVVKGTTSFVAVIGALMTAINVAAFAMANKPSKRFTAGNDEGIKKIVIEPYRPSLVTHGESVEQEDDHKTYCTICKTGVVDYPEKGHKQCVSCFSKKKKAKKSKKGKQDVPIENHGPKDKQLVGKVNKRKGNIYEGVEEMLGKKKGSGGNKKSGSAGKAEAINFRAEEDWNNLDYDVVVFNSYQKRSKQMKDQLRNFKKTKSSPISLEQHCKIPTVSLAKSVVHVGSSTEKLGLAFMVKPNVVMFPKHYNGVTHLYYKPSNKSVEVKMEITEMKSLKEEKHHDGVVVGLIKQSISSVPLPLGVPASEFPAIVQGPSFSQTTSSVYDNDIGLITYVLDSNPGDCGQPVVNAETGKIVGMHIGVSSQNKQAKVAYALGFSANLLRKITDLVKGLDF